MANRALVVLRYVVDPPEDFEWVDPAIVDWSVIAGQCWTAFYGQVNPSLFTYGLPSGVRLDLIGDTNVVYASGDIYIQLAWVGPQLGMDTNAAVTEIERAALAAESGIALALNGFLNPLSVEASIQYWNCAVNMFDDGE